MESSYSFHVEGSSAGISGVAVAIWLAFMILMLVTMWKIFTKAGQPGWASLIPFVNIYFMLKIAGKPGWWLLLFLIPFVNFIISILVMVGMARNFGKGVGFALGMIFLPIIFYPILAFGSAEYNPVETA